MELFGERPHQWDGELSRYVTELTGEEEELVKAIDLRMWPSHDEHQVVCKANEQPILALLSSLTQRDGIPEQRWRYWSDPAYQIYRRQGSSRDVFEKNGNPGAEAYTHPHFIPYLRYFLFGAYLPSEVIEEFEGKVGNPVWVTSGNIVPLGDRARELTRQHYLYRDGAALEFFKLSLDIGLGADIARSVRNSVMKIRPGERLRW